ncbi:uncharacterized protein LOC134251195 [Saccostrea cucullata]|uniref:uncharacterized protein LOC134251195 n=1 Tax=Saccostrea cuccullata TaxID=36930 RepID=UPI002ED0AEEE
MSLLDVLETTSSARYLGVDISDNLNWSQQISRVTNKANSSLGFLRRNIPTRNQQLRSAAYKAVVRPQLQYAASVWDPHLVTLINQVEAVQRRAARWVMSDLEEHQVSQICYKPYVGEACNKGGQMQGLYLCTRSCMD